MSVPGRGHGPSVEADALEPLGPQPLDELEDLVDELCSGQGWVRSAAAVFFMTAVVERSMWKYPHAHAYRVLHLDAGHLGQTFQLACTALGLATFVTTATRNRRIEETLALDGVSEFAVYTTAAGPPG